jgi:hypothetical protein
MWILKSSCTVKTTFGGKRMKADSLCQKEEHETLRSESGVSPMDPHRIHPIRLWNHTSWVFYLRTTHETHCQGPSSRLLGFHRDSRFMDYDRLLYLFDNVASNQHNQLSCINDIPILDFTLRILQLIGINPHFSGIGFNEHPHLWKIIPIKKKTGHSSAGSIHRMERHSHGDFTKLTC